VRTAAITIAILDDGVDGDHPDLKEKIVHPFDAIRGEERTEAQLVGCTWNRERRPCCCDNRQSDEHRRRRR
jgi:subtilisin family serine protease